MADRTEIQVSTGLTPTNVTILCPQCKREDPQTEARYFLYIDPRKRAGSAYCAGGHYLGEVRLGGVNSKVHALPNPYERARAKDNPR